MSDYLKVGCKVIHADYGVCTLVNIHGNSAVIRTASNIDIPCFASDLKQYLNS